MSYGLRIHKKLERTEKTEVCIFPQGNGSIIVTFICFSLSLFLASIPLNNVVFCSLARQRQNRELQLSLSFFAHDVEWTRHFLFGGGSVKNEQKLEPRTRKIGSSNCR